MKTKTLGLSVIFPVYNERETIGTVLQEWHDALRTLALDFEIIVCEDGSTDGTTKHLRSLQKTLPFTLDHQDVRRGYGGAVMDGMRQATKSLILCVDSDGQCDPRDLPAFLERQAHSDVVIGWRTERADNIQRLLFSKAFHGLFSLLFPVPIHDPSAPFVLFHRGRVLPHLRYLAYLKEGFWWGFVGMCAKKHLRIVELPMHHRSRLAGDTVVYKPKRIPGIALRNGIGLIKLKLAG